MITWTCAQVISEHGTSPCPPPSWWTPLHIAALCVVAVLAGSFVLAWLLSLRTPPAEDPALAGQTDQARSWLAGTSPADGPDFAAMPDAEVRARVDHAYPGGWDAFVKEMTS